jgi:hypothetical protein
VLLITNVVDNIIIYNFNDATKGGTAATNVLTLTYNTASMSDTDELQIFYDDVDGTVAVSNSDITSCKTALELLDNAVDGNYLNVNMNVAGTDVAGGNGTVSAQTLRVTIASDSTGQVIANGGIAHDSADSGNPVKIGGRASSTPVTAVAANDRVDAFFDVQGRQVVTQKALTGTASNVSASASNVTLLAANTSRLGATIYNDSTYNLYVKLGATSSLTSFSVRMTPYAYYEVPYGYYGIIDGIWDSAVGSARVTQIT